MKSTDNSAVQCSVANVCADVVMHCISINRNTANGKKARDARASKFFVGY